MNFGHALMIGIMATASSNGLAANEVGVLDQTSTRVASTLPETLADSLSLPRTDEGEVDIKRLETASKSGDSRASYALGRVYGDPRVPGGADNVARSAAYLRKAIEQRPGYADAHLWLGNLISEHGPTTGEPMSAAIDHYQKAGDLAESKGYYNISALYFIGKGVKKDITRSKFYAEKAAAMGNRQAQQDLEHWEELVQSQSSSSDKSN